MEYVLNCELKRSTINSAGYDFYIDKDISFRAREWTDIDTGVCIFRKSVDHLPSWGRWFMLVAPRSSLGTIYGMRLSNTVGIIDQDYNGTIRAKVMCDRDLYLPKGSKLMQGILIPYMTFSDEKKPNIERDGGIGSTDAACCIY